MINEIIMNYEDIMIKKLKEMEKTNIKDKEEMKKRWIEEWGEEHWNETQKTVEKMADRIMKWQDKSKKKK
jgi:hypothetical protein